MEQKDKEEETKEIVEESEEKETVEKLEVETEETLKDQTVEEKASEEPEELGVEEPALSKKDEAKPPKEEEEEIVEERIYTVPLGKAWITPPRRRAARATRILREFINKHMKLKSHKKTEEEEEEPSELIISNEVNQKLWSRGIEKPPRKIRIRAAKDKEGNVTLYLAED